MKALFMVLLLLWILCGLAGDWMIDGLGDLHYKAIMRGPLTLHDAFTDDPPSYPWGS